MIVCGYGRSGQALAHFLEREKISVVALDSDPERVRQAAAAGDSVVYGDASRREVLVAAALSRATAVVVSFADTPKALAILAHVRELRPELPVIVRTFDDTDVRRLKEAGAAEIVAEVVEGSLMLATQTMLQLGMPLDQRAGHAARGARGALPAHARVLPWRDRRRTCADATQPRLHTMVVAPNAACVGKSLARAQPPEARRARHGDPAAGRGAPWSSTTTCACRKATCSCCWARRRTSRKAEIRLLQG